MFPGFVNMYKDNDGFIHLYFFNGIDDDNENIYCDINLSNISFSYTSTVLNNGAIDYKFNNKSIVKINCTLVQKNKDKEIEYKVLSLKH